MKRLTVIIVALLLIACNKKSSNDEMIIYQMGYQLGQMSSFTDRQPTFAEKQKLLIQWKSDSTYFSNLIKRNQ